MTEQEYVERLKRLEMENEILKDKLAAAQHWIDFAQIALNTQPIKNNIPWECD